MNKSELESELKKLASKIKEITPATKIYLFGSYAYGTPNEDSDIDLCILTNENRRKLEILREISIIDSCDSKHFSSTFTVIRCNDWCMYIDESLILEELMNSHR